MLRGFPYLQLPTLNSLLKSSKRAGKLLGSRPIGSPGDEVVDDRKLQPLIREIRIQHQRQYAEAAYVFVLEALDYTIFLESRNQSAGPEAETGGRHITPKELLEGLRQYAREEFGPLAPFAFRSWGVHATEDFGRLVFQMCEAGLLKRTENDRQQDFVDVFDFRQAFSEPDPQPGS